MAFILCKLNIMMLLVVLFIQKGRGQPHTGLRNKHVRIAISWWDPFFKWGCPGHGYDWEDDCPNDRIYTGVMWDLLLFMKEARNFTYTLIREPDWVWGICHAINNCTGMVGMVNRKEVDFALGRFENKENPVQIK